VAILAALKTLITIRAPRTVVITVRVNGTVLICERMTSDFDEALIMPMAMFNLLMYRMIMRQYAPPMIEKIYVDQKNILALAPPQVPLSTPLRHLNSIV
jgi:hypothetical protein